MNLGSHHAEAERHRGLGLVRNSKKEIAPRSQALPGISLQRIFRTLRARGVLAVLFFLALGVSAAAPLASARAAGSAATITYRKIFKSSYPEFIEIRVNDSGSGTYDIRQLSDDSSPQPMQLDPQIVQKIFDLAAKLHNFEGVELEMHRRIANLGEKTFRYERGAETHQVNFNYTLDRSAEELLKTFETLARQQSDLSDLQRTMRYDRLGVNDVLRQIEKDYDAGLLPEPQKFLASLDQLGADDHFIDIARDRARALAARVRASR
jgi:hypothetical protein